MNDKLRLLLAALILSASSVTPAQTMLNASSREFYKDDNGTLSAQYQKFSSETIKVDHAHGGYITEVSAVNDYFGSMAEAQKVHFNDGGQFDKLYSVK